MCAQLFSAKEIKEWDAYTIEKAGKSAFDLMEQAAMACTDWLHRHYADAAFAVFCAKGNNGGDGIAIARLLEQFGYQVRLFILENEKKGSPDFEKNLGLLDSLPLTISLVKSENDFPALADNEVVIDALFGIGLSAPLLHLQAALVAYINEQAKTIVAIDMPSGLFADKTSLGYTVINATHTLTFEQPKLALLLPENAGWIGNVQVLPIGLDKEFRSNCSMFTIDSTVIKNIYRPRKPFAHKGNFGHALVVGGSYGKIGAIVLAAKACLHTGAGLTTALLPRCGYQVMQSSLPEVMVRTDEEDDIITAIDDTEKYTAIGIGPGLGKEGKTKGALIEFLSSCHKPLVLDADALNILSEDGRLDLIPVDSILTPHPKEFERLFGKAKNDFERLELLQEQARGRQIFILLKGRHSVLATPAGEIFFNTTGNAGLAKGGSGDVLTGMITALLAQGYSPKEAVLLGVYLHGLAADEAARKLAMESMTATDVIGFITEAYRRIDALELR